MIRRIELDLFVRLMRLPPGARADLLEYLGQTDVPPQNLLALLERAVQSESEEPGAIARK